MFINGFDFGGREVLEFAFECLFVFVCVCVFSRCFLSCCIQCPQWLSSFLVLGLELVPEASMTASLAPRIES